MSSRPPHKPTAPRSIACRRSGFPGVASLRAPLHSAPSPSNPSRTTAGWPSFVENVSDIDLLILVDGDKLTLSQEDAITTPLYELELKTGVAISPIVMLKKQWANRPMVTPFYLNIFFSGF